MPQRDGTGTRNQQLRRGHNFGLFGTDREGIKKSDENTGLFGRLENFFEPDQREVGGGRGRGRSRRRNRQGRGQNRS